MKYIFILLMTVISAFGGYFLKNASGSQGIKALIKNKYLWLGGFCYVLAAVFNIWLLQVLPYSIVVPLGSLTYVWSLLIAKNLLGEKITGKRIAGISLIFIGVVLIAV